MPGMNPFSGPDSGHSARAKKAPPDVAAAGQGGGLAWPAGENEPGLYPFRRDRGIVPSEGQLVRLSIRAVGMHAACLTAFPKQRESPAVRNFELCNAVM